MLFRNSLVLSVLLSACTTTDGEPMEFTFKADVQPILKAKCGACHDTGGVGGTSFVSNYDAVLETGSEASCGGVPVHRCIVDRIRNGEMPSGTGCTGTPEIDSTNPACVTALELETLMSWSSNGAPGMSSAPDAGADLYPDATTLPDAAEPDAMPLPDGMSSDAMPPDAVPTYTADIQPLLAEKCAYCHEAGGSGGVDFVSSYASASMFGSEGACSGATVYSCMFDRVTAGEMPFLAGCTGDPVVDSSNSSCLTQAQLDLLSAWIAAGAPES